MIIIIYCAIVFFFCSCSKSEDTNIQIIDLTQQTDSICLLSNIAESIEYYPLNGIEYLRTIELLNDYIWVYSERTGEGYLYKKKTGELANSINFGLFMEGPGYMPYTNKVTNTAFSSSKEKNFICYKREEKRSKVYYSSITFNTQNGQVVDSIAFPANHFQQINDFVINNHYYNAKVSIDSLKWYDKSMRLSRIDCLPDTICGISYRDMTVFSLLDKLLFYHAPTSETIYKISPIEKAIPLYKFYLGTYKPNFNRISKIKDIEKKHDYPYYYLAGSQISENYIWSNFYYKRERYNVLFDRYTLRHWIIPTKMNEVQYELKPYAGLKNDLDGGIDFWPKRISKTGEIYTWYKIKDLKEMVEQNQHKEIKNPEAAKRLKELLKALPHDTGYIVAVLKEKK